MTEPYQPGVRHDGLVPEHALVLVFHDGRLLVRGAGTATEIAFPRHDALGWLTGGVPVPPASGPAHAPTGMTHFLGHWQGQPVFTLAWPEAVEAAEAGWQWLPLRQLLALLDGGRFHLAARAAQILGWARDHRYCGRCGGDTGPDARGERALVCGRCGFGVYPRINPCVIGIVTRGDEILLARAHRFANGMYSALAGFMEVGESAEQTFAREVREEVGVEVRDLRYFGSQCWPFPSNLMLGFLAEYAGGDIRLQEDEIADAAFFHYTDLPLLPPAGSIARAMIDHFIAERRAHHA